MSSDAKGACCVVAVVVGLICLCFGGCFVGSYVPMGEGQRDGVVVRVSHRGILFKTYEGKLVLGGVSVDHGDGGGAMGGQPFEFTVRDPEVVKKLQNLPAGKRVRVTYEETATRWGPKGDTSYFVTAVEEK